MWEIVLKLEGGSGGIGYEVTAALTNWFVDSNSWVVRNYRLGRLEVSSRLPHV